jgi:HEAT repeat protein
VNGEALQVLVRLLLHGSPESRRTAAEQLLRDGEPDDWRMLVSTVRSGEAWLLRARALEVLGLMAGRADQGMAEAMLEHLCEAGALESNSDGEDAL